MTNYTNLVDERSRHTGIYRRLVWDQPSVVIGNFRKNMLVHPEEDRGLSVREAARLQSFPDGYRFAGSIGFSAAAGEQCCTAPAGKGGFCSGHGVPVRFHERLHHDAALDEMVF